MILDNSQDGKRVHEWITQHIEEGELDVVTGYFTIGALAYLAEITNNKINAYRFVLGDIVSTESKLKPIDLLNANLSVDNVLKLKKLAKEVVSFLQQEIVSIKTLEPNFCHAKLFLQRAVKNSNSFYVTGSSNLTEAGVGKKITSNCELNTAYTGNTDLFDKLVPWFEDLWNRPQAHNYKTITDSKGNITQVEFKQYLIDIISQIFKIYSPEQIYQKILFELFDQNEADPQIERQLIKLEDTVVYNKLYDFQKAGVKSLIRMLETYKGAILADAVGLGKTWSALAVMKSYQSKADVFLICPKKLEQNWRIYLKRSDSIFEDDKLDYQIKFHTDLREGGFDDSTLQYLLNEKPKLIVIDESHNLRNDKSSRYNYLVEEILKKSKGDIKVLLLSATPINNSFKDVRNQFKLLCRGANDGFRETLGINSIEYTFADVSRLYNEWSNDPKAKLGDFYLKIKNSAFFTLTDNLIVARTRKSVKAYFDKELKFPNVKQPIGNIYLTPLKFGNFETFEELLETMNFKLSVYQPNFYTLTKEELEKWIKERKGVDVTADEVQREYFLVKMMMVLLLKRLESSWYSFKLTIQKIYNQNQNAIDKIIAYKEHIINSQTTTASPVDPDDDDDLLNNFLLGNKNPVDLAAIDKAGNIDIFKKDLIDDNITLEYILNNVDKFEKKLQRENKLTSIDTKLERLLNIIKEKQLNQNKKVLIFSAYKDTIEYLFNQLNKRGFENFAMVTGNENKVWNETTALTKHEPILQRFAPYTKLYRERNWPYFKPSDSDLTEPQKYAEWIEYISDNHPDTLEKINNPINILLATDVLSEGQNLQDADLVINYDIHWNPVRVIQRVGRIDRIGSPNEEIEVVNFWPAKSIDDYIDLKSRVERRMAIMRFAGAQVLDGFTQEFTELAEASHLEDEQNKKMLLQMKTTMESVDTEETIGFDDFSFDNYRQYLNSVLTQPELHLANLPKGIFSGFKIPPSSDLKPGIIALLGYPAQKVYRAGHRYLSYELIYIDADGNAIAPNEKIILEKLAIYYKEDRFVPSAIDEGEEQALLIWSKALRQWIEAQARTVLDLEDGTQQEIMADVGIQFLEQLRNNPRQAQDRLRNEGSISQKYNFDNFDLIAWLIISE